MDDEAEGGCDAHEGPDCPICAGRMSPEFIEWMKAAGDQPGARMTAEQFKEWLDRL